MTEQGITHLMVESVLAQPETVIEGDTADEYDARIGDRRMRVVLTRNHDPVLVITAYWIAEGA